MFIFKLLPYTSFQEGFQLKYRYYNQRDLKKNRWRKSVGKVNVGKSVEVKSIIVPLRYFPHIHMPFYFGNIGDPILNDVGVIAKLLSCFLEH